MDYIQQEISEFVHLLLELEKKFPNDQDLGLEVRKLISEKNLK